eukprot:m.97992 g.97992  ORF g.97992 m.97992 type:complete len:109 (+) comp13621_c0_seq3:171-497(+)
MEEKLEALNKAILSDPGGRGVRHFHVHGDFRLAAVQLFEAESVGIVFGFPCNNEYPYIETDGKYVHHHNCDISYSNHRASWGNCNSTFPFVSWEKGGFYNRRRLQGRG